MAAKIYVGQKHLDKAQAELQWVIDHGKGDAFRQIASLRLARLYLSEEHPQKALSILSALINPAFKGVVLEVQGDAYLQMKQVSKARVAYQASLKALPKQAVMKPLIKMKLEALPAPIKK